MYFQPIGSVVPVYFYDYMYFQPIGSVVPVYFYAYDPDGSQIFYQLIDSYHSQFFNLHPSDPQITVLKRLNRDHHYRPMVYRFSKLAKHEIAHN